ncbi:hypothetical protein H4582DRAFT_2054126 [Lactarius indigo]|nr:hypothetical protein H4582DRAFT_2054126 [Lactarius indigo]
MSPLFPHAAPHGVTLTLCLVALVGAFDAPPFRPGSDLGAPLSATHFLLVGWLRMVVWLPKLYTMEVFAVLPHSHLQDPSFHIRTPHSSPFRKSQKEILGPPPSLQLAAPTVETTVAAYFEVVRWPSRATLTRRLVTSMGVCASPTFLSWCPQSSLPLSSYGAYHQRPQRTVWLLWWKVAHYLTLTFRLVSVADHHGHASLRLWRSAAGDVHTISLNGSTNGNPYYHTINCVPGPVHCIAENGIWLAIGSGKAVQLVKQATIDPIKFPELDGELPEPMVRSLHFLNGGKLLLVTYLDHGVIAWNLKTLEIKWRICPRACKIGCSIVSHNEKILALTNLYDGIDWYSLDSNHFMDASYQHTTTHPIPDNVILPITFIHGNSAVLSGTSDGCARITTVTEWALGERLRHNHELFVFFEKKLRLRALPIAGDIVQALAYSSTGDARQIVTGVSEKAAGLVIGYWIQESGSKKPAQQKSQREIGRGRAYLTGYVRQTSQTFLHIILLAATQLDWTAVSANGTKGSERVEMDIDEFAVIDLVLRYHTL